jgi:hypothetical protein
MQHLKYQGRTVRSVRDARQGDAGFQGGEDHVMATLDDGTEKLLKRDEIEGLGPKGEEDKSKQQGESSPRQR